MNTNLEGAETETGDTGAEKLQERERELDDEEDEEGRSGSGRTLRSQHLSASELSSRVVSDPIMCRGDSSEAQSWVR